MMRVLRPPPSSTPYKKHQSHVCARCLSQTKFFEYSPPHLAGSCFCAWELIEDAKANPFEWRALASDRLQFRSRQLSAGLNGDGEFLIAGGVQSGEHANLINTKQLLNL